MKMLMSRLYEQEKQKQMEQQEGLHGDKKDISWGSQIRSYVLQPYRMVKDHRTGVEVGDVDAVLDGDLDGFIEAYLREHPAEDDATRTMHDLARARMRLKDPAATLPDCTKRRTAASVASIIA